MKRLSPRRLALVGLLVLLLAGGAVAAIAATSSGGKPAPTAPHSSGATAVSDTHAQARKRSHRVVSKTLAAAAGYLGENLATLRGQLRAGKSLAQIASAKGGKSEAGLIAALEKTQSNHVTRAAKRVEQRVKAQVQAPGGPHARARVLTLRADALKYLGITVSQLRKAERAGKTLAQIANSTPGKSEAGLIEAIVNDRTQQLDAAMNAGRLGASADKVRTSNLHSRVTRYVHRSPKILGSLPSSGTSQS